MPAFNPFTGPAPMASQYTGGAVEKSASDSAAGVVGAANVADASTQVTPQVLGCILLASLAVIVGVRLLGIRGGVAVSAGVGK